MRTLGHSLAVLSVAACATSGMEPDSSCLEKLRGADALPFCFLAVNGAGGPRAERRNVSIGAVHGERVVVEEGLAPGDRVITRGQHFLRPGDAVRPVEDAS